MKTTFTLFLILVVLIGCKENTENIKEYSIHPFYKLHGKQTGYEEYIDENYYAFGVQLDLTTEYDTLPPIHFMTCSWADDFGRTSDSTYYIGYHPCDANFEYFGRITSKDTLRFLNVVVTSNEKEFDIKRLRIGISLIDTIMVPVKDSIFSHLFSEEAQIEGNEFYNMINDPQNIVWSDPILLSKLSSPITHSGRVQLICGKESTHEHCN